MIVDNKTIKFCPYCGEPATRVNFEGHYNHTRLGKFEVECSSGHVSDVYWPDEDHDEDCECEKHSCPDCGERMNDEEGTCKCESCSGTYTRMCPECGYHD